MHAPPQLYTSVKWERQVNPILNSFNSILMVYSDLTEVLGPCRIARRLKSTPNIYLIAFLLRWSLASTQDRIKFLYFAVGFGGPYYTCRERDCWSASRQLVLPGGRAGSTQRAADVGSFRIKSQRCSDNDELSSTTFSVHAYRSYWSVINTDSFHSSYSTTFTFPVVTFKVKSLLPNNLRRTRGLRKQFTFRK